MSKEITENIGFGIVSAGGKAVIDYASGKKITLYSSGKNTVIAAATKAVYDYGKTQKWWPWG